MTATFTLRHLARIALFFVLLAAPALASADPAAISGVIRDERGDAVPAAQVALYRDANDRPFARATSGPDGAFVFEQVPAGSYTLRASAPGLVGTAPLDARGGGSIIHDLALRPLLPSEELTVTASRSPSRVADTPASVAVLGRSDLAATAAATLDDALRQVVGFTTFRRGSSRTANPTTQGVSLRGTGASGASRSLVLLDGVPLNDPFGGWVAWGRVPREEVQRIEVLRGGASDLYGDAALGGVVNVLTNRPDASRASLELSGGAQGTAEASGSASAVSGDWGFRLAGEGFRTDGYVPVAEDARGPVDTEANSRRAVVDALVERRFETGRVFLSGALFGERRDNGTALQVNATTTRTLAAGFDWDGAGRGVVTVRAFALNQDYSQTFSAVSADRATEFLTRLQLVPSQAVGGSVQWAGAFGRQTIVAGADGRETRGSSDEAIIVGGSPFSFVGAGGRERAFGAFAQDTLRLGNRWVVMLGARADRWRQIDGLSVTTPVVGPASVRTFPDRTETAASPRVAVLFRATPRLSFGAAGYRSFRAPTLNELYRAFRVGNVLTLANPALRAERLTGGEVTARWTSGDRFEARASAFWTDVTRPVANVTLDFTPELITRRRDNLGRLRSRGVEVESEYRPTRGVALSAGYLFARSIVEEFPANRSIEGLRVPQVPAHQFTAQLRYDRLPRLILGAQLRASSSQFDDDLNRLALGAYGTVDALAAYRLSPRASLFAAAENVFNTRYAVARTPVETVGPPATVRFGIRLYTSEH